MSRDGATLFGVPQGGTAVRVIDTATLAVSNLATGGQNLAAIATADTRYPLVSGPASTTLTGGPAMGELPRHHQRQTHGHRERPAHRSEPDQLRERYDGHHRAEPSRRAPTR